MSEPEEKGQTQERQRVQTFLRHVEAGSKQKEQELAAARLTTADLERRLKETNASLDRRTKELERLRGQYEADLRNRGAELERLVHEKLAAALEDVRGQLANQYEERIRSLEVSLTDQEAKTIEIRRERDSLRADQQSHREQTATHYEKVVTALEKTLGEKTGLVERANETAATLQAETERLRVASERDVKGLAEKHGAVKRELEETVSSLRAERLELQERVDRLEALVAADDNIQRLKELEAAHEDLLSSRQQREELLESILKSLAMIREVCTKSPAARSIIGGAGTGLDLDKLFEPLE